MRTHAITVLTALATVATLAAGTAPLSAPAVAVPPAVPAAAPADSTPGYARRAITVTVHVGPDRDQACVVTADLYRPDGVNRRHRAPATGHRLRLVLAASDTAYAGNAVPQAVAVPTSATDPGVLRLPMVSTVRF